MYYNNLYFIKKEGVYSVMYDLNFLKNSKNRKNLIKMTMITTKKIKKALKEIPTIFQLSVSSQILTLYKREPTMSIL